MGRCAAIFALLLSGCAIERNGTVHHVVIGFGIVSVPATTSPAAQAVRTQALGIHISDAPGPRFTLGYVNGIVVTVADGATNIIVETSAGLGKFKLRTQ